jgi:hypothetical protein
MKVKLKAPRSWGSTRIAASSMERSGCAAISEVTRSESVVAVKTPVTPASAAVTASSAVFTRLPLWQRARPVPADVVRKVGWAFSHVLAPVVLYRVWPTATWPRRLPSVGSSNTWLTRPRSL